MSALGWFILGFMLGGIVGIAILIFFQSIKENEEGRDCEQIERQDSGED